MVYFIFYFLIVVNISISQECPPVDTLSVNPSQSLYNIPYHNNWDELEVMTWNIKNFPQDDFTVFRVEEIISDILPDIIGFQELTISGFNELRNMIPAYGFINTNYLSMTCCDEEYNEFLNLGIAYRKDCLELLDYYTLFEDSSSPFVDRAPLAADFLWSCGDNSMIFKLINVHFDSNAGGASQAFQNRLEASEIINSYIEDQMSINSLSNIIVLGDFNDSIDDPENSNSLWPLISDDNLYFVDTDIANGTQTNWSYPSYPSHIDHILINQNLFDENINSTISTLLLNQYITNYSTISDHRPVLWSVPINNQDITNGLVINEIMYFTSQGPNGDWFEITNIDQSPIDLYGFIIRDDGNDYHIINEHMILNENDFLILGTSNDLSLNGNVNVDYMYNDFTLDNFFDEIIIMDQNGNIIDEVFYTYDNAPNSNIPDCSMSLFDIDLDNNDLSNWFQSDILMNNGNYGTPGSENSSINSPIGDTNLDGVVNIVDIVGLVSFVLLENIPIEQEFFESDLNQDGLINIVDVVALVTIILEN
tara:strand:- start:1497 stop:3104 length:1608 start_codon:yes stop_codon:yes gene_type:complete